MSWNAVKKSSSQPKTNQKKQNVIIDNEDLEGLGNDSIFSALSNIDNKEQKKIEENNNTNKEMKQSSSNSSLPSPKTPKKNTTNTHKTTPLDELSKLNVSKFINENIKITSNEQDQIDQLKKLCNFIETEITNKLYCATTKFSHKSFDIDNSNFKGPISYLNPKQRKDIENVFSKCSENVIKKLFVLITKCIFVGEKKANSSQLISNTIAHQICVQIISNLYPGIFYKAGKEGKPVYEQTISHHKEIVEKLPAIGNTLIWVCKQQHYNINKKEVYCPEYVGLWMECFLSALASSDASIAIKTQSVKLLNQVLNGIKENKDKLKDVNVKIPVESLIALIGILKNDSIVSQLKKNDKLYNGVIDAYNSLKNLLFDKNSNILEFKDSNSDVFEKLHKYLVSDQSPAVYNELLSVMAMTLAKDPNLFEKWGSVYKQFHPKDVALSNDIVKEIKNQQTEYFKNKKYCPTDNCWEELDNDRLRNTFYEIIGTNEEHRSKENETDLNNMNKNIRAILNKTSKAGKGDGGFFSGFLVSLLKKSLLLIILASLTLHIFDSVDEYSAKKNGNREMELPEGHPKVQGGDLSKCPYHNFRNKYSKCNQCHPMIKYVYDAMDEPYKFVESRAVIPAYEKIWKPYCSKPFSKGIEKGFIPAYRYVKPIVRDAAFNNVIPKAVEMYDTYAKEYVDRANENVFKPAYATSSKYAKQAYRAVKPYSIKAKDYVVEDVVKPSLPYLNKAKVRAIQYGNQFLDTLAEIPYKKLMKNGASSTLRFVGHTENNMEKLYTASTPYAKKYWDVLSRKTDALMKQENVQKIVTHPYVKTTTDTLKDAYRIWSDGVKVSYVYLTNRGPETGGARNWKDATDKVSIKKDIRNSIDHTKRFFKNVIENLEREADADDTTSNLKKRNGGVKIVNAKDQPGQEQSLPTKRSRSIPKLAQELKNKITDSFKKGYKVIEKNETSKRLAKEKAEDKDKTKTNANTNSETKQLAKEKAKIKQEMKRVVKEEFQNNISKQLAKEKNESTKHIAKEGATKQTVKDHLESTKQTVKDKAKADTKQVVKDKVEATKQLAKEQTKASTDTKQVAKEDYESTKQVVKDRAKADTKQVVKEHAENTKQVVKDRAKADTKQVVKEHAENTKQVVKDRAKVDAKQVVKEHAENTKQLVKDRAKVDTKQVVKEHNDSTKQLAKEKASTPSSSSSDSDTKQVAKEHVESTKKVAKDQATKQVAKEEMESTKRVAKDQAAKQVAKEEMESTKQVAMDSATKQIAKEEVETTKQVVKEKAKADTKQVVKEHAESTKQVAMDSAAKQIAKEEIETTKQVVKEKAKVDTKQVVKEHAESTKQVAMDSATKQIAKEEMETTKRLAKEQASE